MSANEAMPPFMFDRSFRNVRASDPTLNFNALAERGDLEV